MNNDPILTLLGFGAKAGKLSFGTHATQFAITSNKARLVCAAEDISAKSVKELRFKAEKQNIPVIILHGIDTQTLSKRVGKTCGILAVNDERFAASILKNHKEEKRYDG